jgi:hypothetical protein
LGGTKEDTGKNGKPRINVRAVTRIDIRFNE